MIGIWENWYPNPYSFPDWMFRRVKGDGNCQFTGISECLKPQFNLTADELRETVGQQFLTMREVDFERCVEIYNEENAAKEFKGGWIPRPNMSRKDMYNAITESNKTRNYWYYAGDMVTLWALSKALKINIFVVDLKQENIRDFTDSSYEYTIFIGFSSSSEHYICLGQEVVPGKFVQSVFRNANVPKSFLDYVKSKKLDIFPPKPQPVPKQETPKTLTSNNVSVRSRRTRHHHGH